MLLEETVYLNTDGVITLALRQDTQALTHIDNVTEDIEQPMHSHPAINRIRLLVAPIIDDPTDSNVTIDSALQPSWFDFASQPPLLMLKLGAAALKPGRHVALLQVFETGSPLGIVWTNGLMLTVINPN